MMATPSPIFSIRRARRSANSCLGSESVKSACAEAPGAASSRQPIRVMDFMPRIIGSDLDFCRNVPCTRRELFCKNPDLTRDEPHIIPAHMALTVGSRVGVYEITSTLGVGGMGEVYRARDGRLNREVALKVLPDLFAADP